MALGGLRRKVSGKTTTTTARGRAVALRLLLLLLGGLAVAAALVAVAVAVGLTTSVSSLSVPSSSSWDGLPPPAPESSSSSEAAAAAAARMIPMAAASSPLLPGDESAGGGGADAAAARPRDKTTAAADSPERQQRQRQHHTNNVNTKGATGPSHDRTSREEENAAAMEDHDHEEEEEQEEEDVRDDDDDDDDRDDRDCIFRHSKLYRKIYVYPNPGTEDYRGAILSDAARDAMAAATATATAASASARPRPRPRHRWPWLRYDRWARRNEEGPYDLDSEFVQYSTELLVREVMTHPRSCLRTHNPETALLFYVPYMPSLESAATGRNYTVQSPYGQALLDVIAHQNYTGWESPQLFGFASTYWKRRNGADHVVVYSEPLHGLYHVKRKRGSYHYLHTQQQLRPPIAVSIELSKTFVNMHPRCARKNILMPYPNPDGRWFNGEYERQTLELVKGRTTSETSSAQRGRRPATMYYRAGNRGFCRDMRRSLQHDYEACSRSFRTWHQNVTRSYRHGMRISTFCPAPVGDSPSAKRMYDCLHGGSVPVVLSNDFVWPFTTDVDGAAAALDGPSGGDNGSSSSSTPIPPETFSIQYDTGEFFRLAHDPNTCQLLNASRPGLEDRLESIPLERVQKWQQAGTRMSDLYSWYRRGPDLPDHPLLENVLPDGGAAFQLVELLEERSDGSMWEACREELQQQARSKPPPLESKHFKC